MLTHFSPLFTLLRPLLRSPFSLLCFPFSCLPNRSDKTRKHNIYARIDRPDGIITFEAPETAETILTDWADGIDEMLKVSRERAMGARLGIFLLSPSLTFPPPFSSHTTQHDTTQLVDRSCHLIEKEQMVNKMRKKQAKAKAKQEKARKAREAAAAAAAEEESKA